MSSLLSQSLHLAVWLGILLALFVPLERLMSVHRQPVLRTQWLTDLGYYALNSLTTGILLAVPLMYFGVALYRVMPEGILWRIAALPLSARLALSVVIAEIGFYWGHRLSHQIPLLWRFHSIHHSATAVDFLTNTRAHPLDMVFTRLCGFVPVVALGLAGGAGIPALVLVIATLWGFFVHANVRWRFGPLEHVIATPFFHRWHHTQDALRDRNYAAMLPLVDHLFGTYVRPAQWPERYGIDTPMPATLGEQLIHPFLPRPAEKRPDINLGA